MTEYDLYDLAAVYMAIRFCPDAQGHSQALSAICKILSDAGDLRPANAIRTELAKIQDLDKELYHFVFTENVYTHIHGILKDEKVFSTLLEATKQLHDALGESRKKAVALADALHNLPVDIADNHFQIPDTFWEREVADYRNKWDANFLLEQERTFDKKPIFLQGEFITGAEFENQFLASFTKNIDKKVLKKNRIIKTIGHDYYLWNLFGYELLPCFSGKEAREEYDKADKNGAFEIQYDNGFTGDEKAHPLNQEHMTAMGIDASRLTEFYVVGKDFSWCYVVTHEFDRCGPFFCYKPE